MATDLLALAKRCEAATGPDRALGDEIMLACGWGLNASAEDLAQWRRDDGDTVETDDGDVRQSLAEIMDCLCWYPPGQKPFRGSWENGFYRKDPTASVDFALTLVPERSWIRTDEWPAEFRCITASVQSVLNPPVSAHRARAATLPLALCAAALRARATPTP